MFLLILAVLNRDYSTPCYNPDAGLLLEGETRNSKRFQGLGRRFGFLGCWVWESFRRVRV